MANHMDAKRAPVFQLYYAWATLGDDGTPATGVSEAITQPQTIPLRFNVQEGRHVRNVRKDIVPDRAELGAEYPLHFLFDQFETKIIPHLDPAAANFASELFRLFAMCFQGKGVTKWQAAAAKHPVETRTAKDFK